MKRIVAWGCLNGFLGVALGAFGAHGLKDRLSADMLEVYHTGVQYQMYHAFALLAAGLLASRLAPDSNAGIRTRRAAACFLAGIVLFSGSLYALSLSGIKWLGAITPLGGLAFLAGWVLLGMTAWKERV